MSATTGISWTDATWNPIRGCSRVSDGCRNCYAEKLAARFNGPGQPFHELATVKNGHAAWTGGVSFIEEHLLDPLRWKRPRRVFVNSMSDLFHEKVRDEWLDRIFAVMLIAGRHTFQVLTKRPERMRQYLGSDETLGRVLALASSVGTLKGHIRHEPDGLRGFQLPNVHVGVSVENQETADERIPLLLDTPAAVRWISAEPLIGRVDLRRFAPFLAHFGAAGIECQHGYDACPLCDRGVDWVVVGGESGSGHRPMSMTWLEELAGQCLTAHVPVFVKQDSGARPGVQGRIPDHIWNLKQFPAERVTSA